MMADPWAFGWSQALTIIGFLITIGIALGGFQTFERWKKQKLEERRIEIAFEALAIAHESKFVFEGIRASISYDIDYESMPVRQGESSQDRSSRGAYYAVLRRINQHNEYFDRAIRILPKCMAAFGADIEPIFRDLFTAKSHVMVAAQALTWEMPLVPPVPSEEDYNLRVQLRHDLWGGVGGDRVEARLRNFRDGIERKCRPTIDRGFKSSPGI
jgi:hypothetical protein